MRSLSKALVFLGAAVLLAIGTHDVSMWAGAELFHHAHR